MEFDDFFKGLAIKQDYSQQGQGKKEERKVQLLGVLESSGYLKFFLLEKINSLHFITQQKLEELKKQLEEKKAVVENLKGTDIFE